MILLEEAMSTVAFYLFVYLLLIFFKGKHLRATGSKFQLFIPFPNTKQHEEGFSSHIT